MYKNYEIERLGLCDYCREEVEKECLRFKSDYGYICPMCVKDLRDIENHVDERYKNTLTKTDKP